MKKLTLGAILLGVGFFISPVIAQAADFRVIGDPYDSSSYNATFNGQWSTDPTVATGTYTLASIVFNGRYDTGQGSTPAQLQVRGGVGNLWRDCFSESFIPSDLMPQRNVLDNTVGQPVRLNFTGTECSVNDTNPSSIYVVSPAAPGVEMNFVVLAGGNISTYGSSEYILSDTPFDFDPATHIIDVITPDFYEVTASSTVPIQFSWRQNLNEYPANTYRLDFVNTLSYQSFSTPVTWLTDAGMDGDFTQSDTVVFPSEGTWKMTITIGDGSGDVPGAPFLAIDTLSDYWFSVVVEDNTQSVEFGPAYKIYDEESCILDWDLDFSVSDCAGYLFIPGKNLFAAYTSLRDTLSTKFPFSYLFSIASVWESLTVTGETFDPAVIEYASSTIAVSDTSFGNPLPNFEFFSEETVTTYLPPQLLSVFRLLMAAVIWMSLFAYIFNEVRFMLKTRNV